MCFSFCRDLVYSIKLIFALLLVNGGLFVKSFPTINSDTPQIFSHILPKATHSHTDLKVGLSIEAGCGDVTGAIWTI